MGAQRANVPASSCLTQRRRAVGRTATVRSWSKLWKETGPHELEEVEFAAEDYLTKAVVIRDLALQRMKDRLDRDEGILAQTTTAFGVLQAG